MSRLRTILSRLAISLRQRLTNELESIRANLSPSTERVWLLTRLLIAVVVVIGASLLLRDRDIYPVFMVLMGLVVVYSVPLAILLWKGRLFQAFLLGLGFDNLIILGSWVSFMSDAEGATQTNDLYLALFPLITMGIVRLGWFFGGLYSLGWMTFLVWSTQNFYGLGSYDVQQLPIRVLFLLITTIMVARMAIAITRERRLERERLRELEMIERFKTELLYTVSHELRTPLTLAKTATGILSERASDITQEQMERALRLMQTGINRLENIFNRALDYSRVEEMSGEFKVVRVDVAAIAEEVYEKVKSEVSAKQQTLTLDLPPRLEAHLDPEYTTSVLLSIVDNSIKYTPSQGNIIIRARKQMNELNIEVIDDGPGIPIENIGFLSFPFYRGSRIDTHEVSGVGLSLATARRLIELRGGRLSIKRLEPKGTSVSILLPSHTRER